MQNLVVVSHTCGRMCRRFQKFRGTTGPRPLGGERSSELSMDWVDPRVGLGWVELGREWVEICVFSGLGWVMGLK